MKTKMIFSAIVVLLLFAGGAGAQVILTAQEAVLSEQDKAFFDRHIRNQNYAVFTLDTSELLDSLRTHEYCNVQLYISEQWNWEFYLIPDKRWTGEGGVTCGGKTSDNEDVVLSIDEDFFMALIFSKKGDINIDRARYYSLNDTDESFIVFKVSDLFEISNDEAGFDLPVSIHFNQTSNILNIKHNTPAQERMHLKITILNTQGRRLKVYETSDSNISLSLNELVSGLYFVQVIQEGKKKSKTVKIIIRE